MKTSIPFMAIVGHVMLIASNGSAFGQPTTQPASRAATMPSDSRPARWAKPIPNIPGAPNLHKINENLYRGAQPTAEGFRQLKAMGIKTVINLRSFHSDRDELGDTGLRYIHVWAKAHHAEDEDTAAFLKAASNPENWPVFVHCQHGADRTGTMIAAYRLVMQNWDKPEAIQEMTQGEYGFFSGWTNLVAHVRGLDVPALQRQYAGRRAPTTHPAAKQ